MFLNRAGLDSSYLEFILFGADEKKDNVQLKIQEREMRDRQLLSKPKKKTTCAFELVCVQTMHRCEAAFDQTF